MCLCRDDKDIAIHPALFACNCVNHLRIGEVCFALCMQTFDMAVCHQCQVACHQCRLDECLPCAPFGTGAAPVASTKVGVVTGMTTLFVPGEYGARRDKRLDAEFLTTLVKQFDDSVLFGRWLGKIRRRTRRLIGMGLIVSADPHKRFRQSIIGLQFIIGNGPIHDIGSFDCAIFALESEVIRVQPVKHAAHEV